MERHDVMTNFRGHFTKHLIFVAGSSYVHGEFVHCLMIRLSCCCRRFFLPFYQKFLITEFVEFLKTFLDFLLPMPNIQPWAHISNLFGFIKNVAKYIQKSIKFHITFVVI